MFHVEQCRFSVKSTLFVVLICILGCKQPPENPFSTDVIFNDYGEQLKSTEAAIGQVDGLIKENKENVVKTPVQSPQLKFFSNKLEGLYQQRVKLEQQKRYWEGKIQERKVQVTYRVYKAFYADEPTDGIFAKETEQYLAAKKLRQAKLIWSQKEQVEKFNSTIRKPASEAKPAGH